MQDTFFSCLLFSLTPLHILFSFQLIQETCFLDIKEITECVCVFMCTYLCVCACVNMCVCLGNYMFICVVVIRNLGNPWDFISVFCLQWLEFWQLFYISSFCLVGSGTFFDLHCPALCGFMAWILLQLWSLICCKEWTLIMKERMCLELENQLK